MKHEITSGYSPHLPVRKMDRKVMKQWIVFGAKTKNNCITLKDSIKQGQKLQNEFFICEIEEIYMRVEISPMDHSYHRFRLDRLYHRLINNSE
jgi:hypothetical protein